MKNRLLSVGVSIVLVLVLTSTSAFASGATYMFIMKNNASWNVKASVSTKSCLVSYTGDTTVTNGTEKQFVGQSDQSSGSFLGLGGCATSSSYITYAFKDSNGVVFSTIALKDPAGSGGWEITSANCDVSNSSELSSCIFSYDTTPESIVFVVGN